MNEKQPNERIQKMQQGLEELNRTLAEIKEIQERPARTNPPAAPHNQGASRFAMVCIDGVETPVFAQSLNVQSMVWRLVLKNEAIELRPWNVESSWLEIIEPDRIERISGLNHEVMCPTVDDLKRIRVLKWLPSTKTKYVRVSVSSDPTFIVKALCDSVIHTREEHQIVEREMQRAKSMLPKKISRPISPTSTCPAMDPFGPSRGQSGGGTIDPQSIVVAQSKPPEPPEPVAPIEIDDAILWHFWQKIMDELDPTLKNAPLASQVFAYYCRDRMTLRKMERKFGWSYRTIKERKAKLEGFLRKKGYTLDRFIVDRSIFQSAEKQLKDERAKRISADSVGE